MFASPRLRAGVDEDEGRELEAVGLDQGPRAAALDPTQGRGAREALCRAAGPEDKKCSRNFARGDYLGPHVLGALCLACDVEPRGDKHQPMGSGFTEAKIEELEQVTGPGIRNLEVLCGLNLNWRTVAFRYCGQLKQCTDRKRFVANLA